MTYTLSEIGYFEIFGNCSFNDLGEVIDEWSDIYFWLKLPNGNYRAIKRIWMW